MKRARVTSRLIARALIESAAEPAADRGSLAEAALRLLEKHGLLRDIPRFSHTVAVMLDEMEGRKRAHLTVGFGDAEKTAAAIEDMLNRTQSGTWNVASESDSGLLGGVTLRIVDDRISASIRAALQQLTASLAV